MRCLQKGKQSVEAGRVVGAECHWLRNKIDGGISSAAQPWQNSISFPHGVRGARTDISFSSAPFLSFFLLLLLPFAFFAPRFLFFPLFCFSLFFFLKFQFNEMVYRICVSLSCWANCFSRSIFFFFFTFLLQRKCERQELIVFNLRIKLNIFLEDKINQFLNTCLRIKILITDKFY